uniref:Uncharacterized protein n=1 Tax=Aegilops tauschii subsp. strangulata TaxID=200361 RepID=A0A453HGF1_AEGTS
MGHSELLPAGAQSPSPPNPLYLSPQFLSTLLQASFLLCSVGPSLSCGCGSSTPATAGSSSIHDRNAPSLHHHIGNSLYRLTAQVELNPESSRLLLQSGWRFEGDDWEIKVRSGSGDPTWSS